MFDILGWGIIYLIVLNLCILGVLVHVGPEQSLHAVHLVLLEQGVGRLRESDADMYAMFEATPTNASIQYLSLKKRSCLPIGDKLPLLESVPKLVVIKYMKS